MQKHRIQHRMKSYPAKKRNNNIYKTHKNQTQKEHKPNK